jgi:citrate synthase
MSEQSLTIRDDRTGKSYTLPMENGTVRAMDLRQIKTDADDFGLMAYDPALNEHRVYQKRDHLH